MPYQKFVWLGLVSLVLQACAAEPENVLTISMKGDGGISGVWNTNGIRVTVRTDLCVIDGWGSRANTDVQNPMDNYVILFMGYRLDSNPFYPEAPSQDIDVPVEVGSTSPTMCPPGVSQCSFSARRGVGTRECRMRVTQRGHFGDVVAAQLVEPCVVILDTPWIEPYISTPYTQTITSMTLRGRMVISGMWNDPALGPARACPAYR